jgi:hypothetical protein
MPANPKSAKSNTNRLLREIWTADRISRIELARRLNFDKSTVTLLINRLISSGLITELGTLETGGGGRRPTELGIRGQYAEVLGIEVLPKLVRIAVLDLEGRVQAASERKIDLAPGTLTATLGEVITSELSSPERNIISVGVAVSGLVDSVSGTVLKSQLLEIERDLPLARQLAERLPLPVMVENDANCCAWGELVARRKSPAEDFLFLLLESDFFAGPETDFPRISLGLGLSLDGRIHHGRQSSSGEFRSVFHTGESDTQFSLTSDELRTLSSDPSVRRRLFDEIASNLSVLINVLSLDRLYIGGDLEHFWEELRDMVEERTGANWPYPDREALECRQSTHGRYAAACGAAAMHLERIFAVKHAELFEARGLPSGIDALPIE